MREQWFYDLERRILAQGSLPAQDALKLIEHLADVRDALRRMHRQYMDLRSHVQNTCTLKVHMCEIADRFRSLEHLAKLMQKIAEPTMEPTMKVLEKGPLE